MARFGDQTAGGDTFPCSGDRALLSKFTLTETGDLTEIVVRFDASSTAGTSIKGLVYSDNAGTPQNRLAIGSAVAVPAGGGLVSSSITLNGLAAGDYWLGFVADSFQAVAQGDVSGGLSRMETTTYASPAATWTQSGTGATQLNVYAEYTPAGAALDVPLGVFDPLLIPVAWLHPMQVPVAWVDEEFIDAGGPAVYTVTPAGGFTLSGAATLARSIVGAVAGGLTLSGAAPIARTLIAPAPSGGLVFSGAATATKSATFEVTASGGLTLSGAATLARAAAITPAGGFTLSGAATIARVDVFEVTPAGGFTLSGAATIARAQVGTTSGGVTWAGAATIARALAVLPQGGVVFSGAATLARTQVAAPAGGFTFAGAGAGTYVPAGANVYTYTSSGGFVFAGDASALLVLAPVVPATPGTSGQFTLPRRPPRGSSYTPRERREFQHVASGGLRFLGSAVVVFDRRQMRIPLAVLASI